MLVALTRPRLCKSINFCNGKTLTDGQQLVQGSCNGVVIGDIIPSSNMPAAKITNPKNFGTFPANTQFTFTANIKNMVTGNFVSATTNYYGAPQQLQGGNVIGHSHVTVQKLSSLADTNPPDPTVFAFFKGINTAAVNGVLSVDVTAGLPEGVYRFCTVRLDDSVGVLCILTLCYQMNTSANHTPALVAIAQHGTLDDCIYATAVAGGGNGGGNNGNQAASSSAAASSSSSSAAPAASSSAAAGGNKNGQGGRGGNRGGRGQNGGRGRFRGGRGRRPQ